jgi:hypothetical protein
MHPSFMTRSFSGSRSFAGVSLRSFFPRATAIVPACVLAVLVAAVTLSTAPVASAQALAADDAAQKSTAQPQPSQAQPRTDSPDPTDPDDHRPAPPAASTANDRATTAKTETDGTAAADPQPRRPRTPPPAPHSSSTTRGPARGFRVAGFVEFGSTSFTASKSFDAILDKSSATILGGGGQVALRNGIFVQVDITHLSEDGERAFVNNGTVFKLGIPATIEMTPIDLTAGYRFRFGRRTRYPGLPPRPTAAERIVPYVGGGVGTVRYKETSTFAQSGDDVDESFTSYNVLGGVEVGIWKWIGAGVEFQQRWVPDGLGTGGVSKAFNETDLGGSSVRLKVIVGF